MYGECHTDRSSRKTWEDPSNVPRPSFTPVCFMGVPLENTTLYALQFADDQVVLAGDKEDLEYYDT